MTIRKRILTTQKDIMGILKISTLKILLLITKVAIIIFIIRTRIDLRRKKMRSLIPREMRLTLNLSPFLIMLQ